MKNYTVLMLVFILLFAAPVALAQDEQPPDQGLPDWAEQIALGSVSLPWLVWAATELTKRLVNLVGNSLFEWTLPDGTGRVIVVFWAIVVVGFALAGQAFGVSEEIADGAEWIYQAMLLFLSLFGAPIVHKAAKTVGLTPS